MCIQGSQASLSSCLTSKKVFLSFACKQRRGNNKKMKKPGNPDLDPRRRGPPLKCCRTFAHVHIFAPLTHTMCYVRTHTLQNQAPRPWESKVDMAVPPLSFGKAWRKMKISWQGSVQVCVWKLRYRAYGLRTGACVVLHTRRTGSYGFCMGVVRVVVFRTMTKFCYHHHDISKFVMYVSKNCSRWLFTVLQIGSCKIESVTEDQENVMSLEHFLR